MILARTPFRITLAGGGTDIPSFYEDHGGFVVSMAINKYIYVLVKKSLDANVTMRYIENEVVESANLLSHDRAREVLLKNSVNKGVEIVSIADLPSKSGMGSSGSFLVAMSAAIKSFKKEFYSLQDICKEACDVEINQLNLPVGKQDQYIAAHGGIKTLDISKSGEVEVHDITDQIDFETLIQHMNVYKIGKYRNAADILAKQNNKNKNTQRSLTHIKDMASDFLHYLTTNKMDEYGKLLDTYWKEKKKLSNKISDPLIDNIYETAKQKYGVLGGKVLGAGGGGFLLLFAPPSNGLDQFMQGHNMPKLNFNISKTGLLVEEV